MITLGTPTAPYAVTVYGDPVRNVMAQTYPVAGEPVRTTIYGKRVRVAEIIAHSDGSVVVVCVRTVARTGADYKSGSAIMVMIGDLDTPVRDSIVAALPHSASVAAAAALDLAVTESYADLDTWPVGDRRIIDSTDFAIRLFSHAGRFEIERVNSGEIVGLVIRSEDVPENGWAVWLSGWDGDGIVCYTDSREAATIDLVGRVRYLDRVRADRESVSELIEMLNSNPWDARPTV